jgi:CRP/FNR family transcriptional regulator, cyclic AMP receptor protein
MPISFPAPHLSVNAHRRLPKATSRSRVFDAKLFLGSAGPGRKIGKFRQKETIFSQGDRGMHVMYLREGSVKLTVVNSAGKEAVVEILGPGDFFGVRCLSGRFVYTTTATAIVPTTVLVIEKNEMIRVLHGEHQFADRFIAYMLARNIRVEDLIDQLFNSSEKRLARALLLLAHYGEQGQPQKALPKVSQEMLAEMIGTTRSRINFFMNKFRKLGFIEYGGKLRGLQVNKSLLSVVLQG